MHCLLHHTKESDQERYNMIRQSFIPSLRRTVATVARNPRRKPSRETWNVCHQVTSTRMRSAKIKESRLVIATVEQSIARKMKPTGNVHLLEASGVLLPRGQWKGLRESHGIAHCDGIYTRWGEPRKVDERDCLLTGSVLRVSC